MSPSPLRAQPVVLVGAARSGTKIFRDALARQDHVTRVPYDINYVWRLGNDRLEHDELTREMLGPRVSDRIRERLAQFAGDAPVLLEKTVSNCLRVPFVAAVVPEARFIHLVRDGRDVIESVRRQWLGRPDFRYIVEKLKSFPLAEASRYGRSYGVATAKRLVQRSRAQVTWGPRYAGIDQDLAEISLLEVCARQWARCVEAAIAGLADVPYDRVLIVRYEDFVIDPDTQLTRAAELFGTHYRPGRIDGMVCADNVGKGLESLADDEIGAVLPVLEPALVALGYAS